MMYVRNKIRSALRKLRLLWRRKKFAKQPFEELWITQGDISERSGLFSSVKKINASKDYSTFRKDHFLCRTVSGGNLGNRGNKYFDYVCRSNIDILRNNKDKLLECDSLGQPHLYKFNNEAYNLTCSDSILPPIFLLAKLEEYSKKLKPDLNIIEIGCGFGINTKIFHDLAGFKSYTHIDVPEMLILQNHYLSYFDIKNVSYINPYKDMEKIKNKYDFLVSDFAYTELDQQLKLSYFENVISNCESGIILGRMDPEDTKGIDNQMSKTHFDLFKTTFNIKYENNTVYGKGGILFFTKK